MSDNIVMFIRSIEAFGFEKLLDIPFIDRHSEGKNEEHFYVYFYKPYGIILQFDTYTYENGIASLNGGYYYYQWRASKEWVIKQEKLALKNGGYSNTHHPCLSSGGYIGDKFAPRNVYDMIWQGDGDCRSGMLYSIERLAEDGEFITPWVKSNGLQAPTFIHFGDHQADYSEPWSVGYKMYEDALKTETPKRFKMLPKYVRDAIRKGMDYERIVEKRKKE